MAFGHGHSVPARPIVDAVYWPHLVWPPSYTPLVFESMGFARALHSGSVRSLSLLAHRGSIVDV